eukprot:TRINITY_DN10144_c0_g1_i1.p1 TRINITY_DN10144_c0_g1~~TRINITY_DN10144_c0_g1_i1.p1  ORF type:complete len:523 (-),score=155.56 TRINITY_DN10144_c0_g1_i1:150-1718(-)
MKSSLLFLFSCLFLGSISQKVVEPFFVDPVNGKDINTCGPSNVPCATFNYVVKEFLQMVDRVDTDIQVNLLGPLHNVTENARITSSKSSQNTTITISSNSTGLTTLQVVGNDFTINIDAAQVPVTFKSIQFTSFVSPVVVNSKVMMKDCVFTRNQASLHVSKFGAVVVHKTQFVDQGPSNRSFVVVTTGGSFEAHDSTFLRNNNDQKGNTLETLPGSSVTLKMSSFKENRVAQANSTGVVAIHSSKFSLWKSSFSNNQAGNGGALFIAEPANAEVSYSNFTSNVAHSGNGGAVVVDGATASFLQCLFSNNTAYLNGGGIYILNGDLVHSLGVVTLQSTNFTSNFHGNQDGNKNGADVWMKGDSQPSFINVTVSSNGDAIYCQPPSSTFNVTTNTTTPGKVSNSYCVSTCRAPHCTLCQGLCKLDNANTVDNTGSGDCFSVSSISCNEHGGCRLFQPSGKDHSEPQCECDATWAAPSCSKRSWLFYLLIVLSITVATVIVAGGVFTIQNRIRKSKSSGYSTLN